MKILFLLLLLLNKIGLIFGQNKFPFLNVQRQELSNSLYKTMPFVCKFPTPHRSVNSFIVGVQMVHRLNDGGVCENSDRLTIFTR